MKVKKLKWVTAGGKFHIASEPETNQVWCTVEFSRPLKKWSLHVMDGPVEYWGSFREAKAAAQAHFEKQVMECLE